MMHQSVGPGRGREVDHQMKAPCAEDEPDRPTGNGKQAVPTGDRVSILRVGDSDPGAAFPRGALARIDPHRTRPGEFARGNPIGPDRFFERLLSSYLCREDKIFPLDSRINGPLIVLINTVFDAMDATLSENRRQLTLAGRCRFLMME